MRQEKYVFTVIDKKMRVGDEICLRLALELA